MQSQIVNPIRHNYPRGPGPSILDCWRQKFGYPEGTMPGAQVDATPVFPDTVKPRDVPAGPGRPKAEVPSETQLVISANIGRSKCFVCGGRGSFYTLNNRFTECKNCAGTGTLAR